LIIYIFLENLIFQEKIKPDSERIDEGTLKAVFLIQSRVNVYRINCWQPLLQVCSAHLAFFRKMNSAFETLDCGR